MPGDAGGGDLAYAAPVDCGRPRRREPGVPGTAAEFYTPATSLIQSRFLAMSV
jgi:hypothetical protein